jgi:hypothetical protein
LTWTIEDQLDDLREASGSAVDGNQNDRGFVAHINELKTRFEVLNGKMTAFIDAHKIEGMTDRSLDRTSERLRDHRGLPGQRLRRG